MRAIYKYPLLTLNSFTMSLPKGAEIVHVDVQNGEAQLWAIIDPMAVYESRTFRIFATGQHIDDGAGSTLRHSSSHRPLGFRLDSSRTFSRAPSS